MDKIGIAAFLSAHESHRARTIVIVDFGNVDKWKESLGWKVGIQELAQLVKRFSHGQKYLRRFYYGEDYGPDERQTTMTGWSKNILERARMNGFELITKRVKYIHNPDYVSGYLAKCELDVEMAVDLIKERDNYDVIILLSGDGDLVPVLTYLRETYDKRSVVMSARGHIAREIIDAKGGGTIDEILYPEDFEYRLRMGRFWR